MRLKVSSGKWRPFCLDLNVLRPLYSQDEDVIAYDTTSLQKMGVLVVGQTPMEKQGSS